MVSSIDNLPCQLPREATEYFGDCLTPHLGDFVRLYFPCRHDCLNPGHIELSVPDS